jgi:hypothetical protein
MKKNQIVLTWVILTLGTQMALAQTTPPNLHPHFDWAAKEADKTLTEQIGRLERFLQQAKEGVPTFVDKALGWQSKWAFIADKVPFTKGDRHAQFLTKTFEEDVFTQDQLEQTIKQLVLGYLSDLDGIENQLLVRVRRDIPNLPKEPIFKTDKAKLQAAVESTLVPTRKGVAQKVTGELGKDGLSLVMGEVLTQVTVKWGVSSGILGAGAASSVTTFGIGLAVGVVADEILSFAWDKFADPKGQLAKNITSKIDELARSFFEGDTKNPGLRIQLQDYAKARQKLWRQTIEEAAGKGGGK